MFQAAGSGGELARAAGLQPGRLPCKGSWMRRKAQTEGCIAGLRWKYPARFGRALPRVLREVRRPGEHNSPEGYLQGQVRPPSSARGDTSPYRGGFWGVRQPAVPGFAARVPYIVGRAFTPAGEACGGGGTADLCKTPSRKAYESTRPKRRARSPALHCGRKRVATRKWQLSSTPAPCVGADASIGPYAGGGRQPGECGGREGSFSVFCRVYGGRESTTARKDICRAGCGTPPSPAATPPLAGEAFGAAAAQEGSPARGAGCAGRRRLRGALPVCGGNIPQGPAGPCPAFCGRCGSPLFPVLRPVCLML